jgi:hypothetical protein
MFLLQWFLAIISLSGHMARKHQAADLLEQGLSPCEIAREMGISINSVTQYLCTRIGEGAIRRSDVVFSIQRDHRVAIEQAIAQVGQTESGILRWLARNGLADASSNLRAYLVFRDPLHQVARGDMYERLTFLETVLHQCVKEKLIAKYGDGEAWWRQGVPLSIRKDCQGLREADIEPSRHPYSYTTVVHLKEIFEKQWAVLAGMLGPKAGSDRKAFLSGLDRLNGIRNRVMHPVRDMPPTEEDFEFLHQYQDFLVS